MSIYAKPAKENRAGHYEIETHAVVCDLCLEVQRTPTASGMRLPDGWFTSWVLGQRLDACFRHGLTLRGEPYDGQNAHVNAQLQAAVA